jgi:hypothetical protein
MWLTLDFVSKRYGMLPSQVLKSGSSMDVVCAQLGVQYENYLNQRAMDRANGKNTVDHNLSVEQMQAMLNSVRNPDAAKSQ